MAWESPPRTWVAGTIVTASIMNTSVRDTLRYLKGLDGAVTLSDALILPDGAGYYLHIPILTTIQRDALTPTAGMLVYNSTTTQFNKYENAFWRADLGFNSDHGGLGGLGDDDHTIYQKEDLLTTQGDLPYATEASTWTRLPKGTAGQSLRMNAGATAPEWQANPNTQQFFVMPNTAGSGTWASYGGIYGYYGLGPAGENAHFNFRLPNDFVALTSAKMVILPFTTGSFDWTVNTYFGASGEAYNANTDSATADGQAVTNVQLLELTISDAFTGVAANDIIGVNFLLDVLTTTSLVGILGLDIKYT